MAHRLIRGLATSTNNNVMHITASHSAGQRFVFRLQTTNAPRVAVIDVKAWHQQHGSDSPENFIVPGRALIAQ